MKIRYATTDEWPQIHAMRGAYFRSVEREVFPCVEQAVWLVCEHEGRIVGCYSQIEHALLSQLWIMDFYRAPGFAGSRAILYMLDAILSEAAASNQIVLWLRDPRNISWAKAIERRMRKLQIEHLGVLEGIRPCLLPSRSR